jgi:hypothetical protein
MKKYLRVLTVSVVVYLSLTLLVDWYQEREYRYGLRVCLLSLGEDGFAHADYLEVKLQSDIGFRRIRGILACTPPIGWLFLRQIEYLDEMMIFASKNMALPESQRFPDAEAAKKFGFDPAYRSPEAIAQSVVAQVR